MTIVYDRHIPFLAEAVQSYWSEVHLCPLEPSAIDAAAIRNADVIVIRTRTQVNEALLQGSKVRLVLMHIAGYSTEGKRNATYMCLAEIARHFHLPLIEPSTNHTTPSNKNSGWLLHLSEQMKSAFFGQPADIRLKPSDISHQIADIFESLRKNYPLR